MFFFFFFTTHKACVDKLCFFFLRLFACLLCNVLFFVRLFTVKVNPCSLTGIFVQVRASGQRRQMEPEFFKNIKAPPWHCTNHSHSNAGFFFTGFEKQ